jgi:hypothetical protein
VHRPSAEGLSVSGGGVSMRRGANPKIEIIIYLSSLSLTNPHIANRGFRCLNVIAGARADEVSVGINEDMDPQDKLTILTDLQKNCEPVPPIRDGLVHYIDKPTGFGRCNSSSVIEGFFVFVRGDRPTAKVECSVKLGNIYLYIFYHLDHTISGHFSRSRYEDFPAIHRTIKTMLTAGTIKQTIVNFKEK